MSATQTVSLFRSYPLGNDLKMAELVSAGLPAKTLKLLATALGLRPAGIAPIVNINEKTISRRIAANAKLKPAESERVARSMRVFAHAVRVFNSSENARLWMNQPLGVLNRKTPLALLASEQGAREVDQVLGRIEHGIFS